MTPEPVPAGAPPTAPARRRLVLACLTAALGGLLIGYDTSVMNSAVGPLAEHFALDAGMRGLVASIFLLGCAVGAWFAGGAAERLGRVRVMVLSALVVAGCAVLATVAPTVPLLVVVRLLAGVGLGAASVMGPAYIAEVAPAEARGRLGGFQQLLLTTGILVSLGAGLAIAAAAGDASATLAGLPAWRWMLLAEVVPAAGFALAAARLPESPRHLVARGRDAEARTVLCRLTGLPEREVDTTVAQIRASLGTHRTSSLRDLRGPALGLRPVVWVGLVFAAFIQLSGINAVFVYSADLWQSVGFSEARAFTMSIVTAAVNVLVTVVAVSQADRFGRRPVLAAGAAAMALALGVTALAFSHATTTDGVLSFPQPWATVALVGVNLVVVAFGLTWGALGWTLLGEMFPNSIRASALAVATAVQWLANFTVTRSFPVLGETVGLPATYAGFAVIMAVATVFVLRFLPETRGRSLEDMDDGSR